MREFRIVLLGLLCFFGCDQNEPVLPQGNLVGFVALIGELSEVVTDKSGITVRIENTSHSSVTDSNGIFELNSIPAGTYNLLYEKEGYGMREVFGFQLLWGNVPSVAPDVALFKQPSIEVQSYEVTYEDGWVNLSGLITETRGYSLLLFINDSSDVSDINYDYSYSKILTSDFPLTSFNISYQDTLQDNFGIIYFKNRNDLGYHDYEMDRTVYGSAKKASDVIEINY